MSKLFKHLKTVGKHRRAVRRLCFKCGLYWQGLTHDLSKYSHIEFWPQVKRWTGTCSPIDIEIKEKGYSAAWLHHKGRNPHHFEYWLDPAHNIPPARMPMKYLAEMFCDRVAASKTYLGKAYTPDAPRKYLESRPQEKDLMHPETYRTLCELFTFLEEWGEARTCAYLKILVHNEKHPNDRRRPA